MYTILGQYDGYQIVKRALILSSSTPTFVAGTLYSVTTGVGKDVPFRVLTGKCMPYGCVEVVIKLKEPSLKLI